MKLIQRFGYYLGGFAMGLVILAFFLSGKKSSCNYFPDARVMQDIRIKERAYSNEAWATIEQNQIDTAEITNILHHGDIDFGRSDTKVEPCHLYLVTGRTESKKKLELLFENCDSIATLQKVDIVD